MPDTRLETALALAALASAAAIAMALSQAPATLARVNTAEHVPLETTRHPVAACQAGEVLPRDTSAVRLRMFSFLGPRVQVRLSVHGRRIAHGERGVGWTGGVVTVPVGALPATQSGVQVCFTADLNGDESLELVGQKTRAALAARSATRALPGRVRIEYLRPGASSWWSLVPAVAHRMGLGRAWSGSWSAILVLALMGGVGALCARAILRGLE